MIRAVSPVGEAPLDPRIGWPEAALAVFVAACMAWMLAWDNWEAVPFHVAYFAVAVVYALRAWTLRQLAGWVIALGTVAGATTIIAVNDGTEHPAELIEVPLMSLLVLAVAWHVEARRKNQTTLHELAEERRRLLERERRLFANISHDLMTPLTIARGHLALIAGDDDSGRTEAVHAEIARVEHVVGEILRAESLADATHLEKELVPIPPLVEAMIARWRGLEERVWDLDCAAFGRLECDPTALEHAVGNLLRNALVHTVPGDVIELSARVEHRDLVLAVTDSGVGIAAGDLPHVRERTFRGDRSRRAATGGAGLGLSIVEEVAQAHGGTVSIDSVEGQGTKVTLRIPGVDRRMADDPDRRRSFRRRRSDAALMRPVPVLDELAR